MAAAADSKSAVRKYVRVRVPPLAPRPGSRRMNDWRGVRVVDGATLERLCGRKSTGGSNPPPSAKLFFGIIPADECRFLARRNAKSIEKAGHGAADAPGAQAFGDEPA